MNNILAKFENVKTNILTTLDAMTDAYMATLNHITPITTVAVAPAPTINVVANAPQPLVASKPQKIYKRRTHSKICLKPRLQIISQIQAITESSKNQKTIT